MFKNLSKTNAMLTKCKNFLAMSKRQSHKNADLLNAHVIVK